MFSWFERRLNPFPTEKPVTPPDTLWSFMWYFCRPAAPWLLLLGLMSMGIAVVEVLLYQYLGNVIDWLANANRETFLADEGWRLVGMGIVVLIVLPMLGAVHTMTMHQTLAGNFGMIARWRMHRYLLRHSMTFFANEFAGRVSTKVMQTALAVREVALKIIDVFVYAVSFVGSMLFLVAAADWRLLGPMIFWLIIYGATLRYFVPRLARISAQQADARSLMTGRVVDSYTNIATIKLFSHAGREEIYAREGMENFLSTVHNQMRKLSGFNIVVDINNAFLIFSTSALAIYFWINGSVTTGAVAVAIGLSMRMNGMSQWIMWEVTSLFENIGMVYDGMSMMNKKHDIVDHPEAKQLVASKGEIVFDQIRFHYGKNKGVIDDLSLTIAAGEKIGLVGRSGAGKTTLMNLLLRFYDLERGTIAIDGQDIAKVSQESLREKIGVVTQDTSLLHRTIRENIAYGHPNASDGEIITAAKRANAWDFIETLVDMHGNLGLDAQVGERGVKLSGGQRQRIAIARVFLKDAPILILDEATSALDSEVEAAIQENLFALMEGKTVIAIAHRLSTLTEMDRLIILDKGKIIQAGSHQELVAEGGVYADLWLRQSGGFIADHNEEQND